MSKGLDELFSEYEQEQHEKTAPVLAAEDAAWLAMTDEQRAAHIADLESRFNDINLTEGDDDEHNCDDCDADGSGTPCADCPYSSDFD